MTEQQNEKEQASGGCPMKRSDGSYSFDWRGLLRHGPGGSQPLDQKDLKKEDGVVRLKSQVSESSSQQKIESGGCPVREFNVYSQPIDPKNQMPKVANQLPSPGQKEDLSTARVKSGIAKGGTEEGTTWTYPSPQMFYNALSRKGKLGDTKEEDVSSLVALHNNMNEKTWKKVVECEQVLAPKSAPKLLKFQGRPQDLSPKAWLKHYLLGHPLPYDRHDWTVLRTDGTQIRYVIDYYYDESRARDSADSAHPNLDDVQGTPSLVVDVRPALDSPQNLFDRIHIPYACHIAKTSKFEALPLRPTPEMKAQVMESVSVWSNIQAMSREDKTTNPNVDKMSEDEAIDLAKSFSKILKDCQKAQMKVNACKSEQDCARASVDLTICMAKIVCPLQHTTLMDALKSDSEDDSVEVAIENATSCVMLNTNSRAAAKEKFPHLFE